MKRLILLLFIPSLSLGDGVSKYPIYGDQVIPGHEKPSGRIPGDNVIPNINLNDANLQKVIESSNRNFRKYTELLEESALDEFEDDTNHIAPQEFDHGTPSQALAEPSRSSTPRNLSYQNPAQPVARQVLKDGSEMMVFTKNLTYRSKNRGIETFTLPSDAAALATINYGQQVRSGKTTRIGMTLNSAFVEPNKAVVELVGCRVSMNVSADPSKERLRGEVGTISCRAPNAETFQIPIRARILDFNDNYAGIQGVTVLNGKLQAGLAAFASDGIEQFGKAMAAAQVTTQVNTNSEGTIGSRGSNVSGDSNKYIAGQTISGATGRFLNWYIDYYEKLQPTVEVESGRKVWLYTEAPIEIPKIFFKSEKSRGTSSHQKSYSDQNRVNTGRAITMTGDRRK